MSDATRLLYLRIAMIAVGLTFIFGIYALGVVWPSGWTWGRTFALSADDPRCVCDAGGVPAFGSRNPDAYRSIIWFTVWSSVVHSAIMAAQAFGDGGERGHLLGDVPALLAVAIVLAVLAPRTAKA